jgi:signal transduction histidine kinase
VELADDGHGFDTRARHSGLGLRGMRERVELAGGELDVSASEEGTRVRATLPSSPAPPAPGAPSVSVPVPR